VTPRENALDLADVGAGFADAVAEAQRIFRFVLDAMAHPGRVVVIPADILLVNKSGLADAAAALALMLLDFETPVWLDGAASHAAGFLRFHCGSPIVSEPKASRFAFAADLAALPPPSIFDLGSDDYPDRSTTLILEVPELRSDGPLTLTGPGIRDRNSLHVGLDAAFWRARAELAAQFPLGLDIVFTCRRRLAALPRTTIVEGF
jgi:alpha-D-ribose 1-methylphosphonate 5-triphosphate synthase subunit PhnH